MDAKYAQNIAEERARDEVEFLAAQESYVPDTMPVNGEAWRIAHAGYVDAKIKVYDAARVAGEINGSNIPDNKRVELNQRVEREKEALEFHKLMESRLAS